MASQRVTVAWYGAFAAALIAAAPALPAQTQWTGPGSNGHWYLPVQTPGGISWGDAEAAAVAMGGYMATIHSGAENAFVFSLIDDPAYWYVDGAGNNEGPWLGAYQPPGSPEPAGGWQWVHAEGGFDFTAWSGGEPNNWAGIENLLVYFTHGSGRAAEWNDICDGCQERGYVVEYDGGSVGSIPEPATMVLFGTGLVGLLGARRVGRRR